MINQSISLVYESIQELEIGLGTLTQTINHIRLFEIKLAVSQLVATVVQSN